MTAILDGLKSLGAARLVALGLVAAGMMALLTVIATRGGNDRMALLYSDLDMREAGQMADALDRAHIAHQMNGAGTELLVPADDVSRARLLLARENLPSGGSIGYEIFDRGDGMTASQFQQSINQTRALEGELSRTIREIHGVRAARVHLVLPRREPFARDAQDAQASVLLTPTGAGRLDRESIQAILNLVAAAVPGLRAKSVTIVDSLGNLLVRAGEPTEAAAAAQTGEEIRRATELRLDRAVEQMLEPSLGQGRVRAEASVEMNFDQVRETTEKFDPDGQVPRSTQTTTDNTKSTEPTPGVSVQNNLPNADAGTAGAAGSQEQRQEETTNFEIGKTVRTLVQEQPRIQRVSLAVLVDGVETRGPDGAVTWRERSPAELDQIAKLARGAIGFDEHRGDTVEVVNMRFVEAAPSDGQSARGILGVPLEKADLMRIAQSLLPALVAVLGLLLVLRPMVLRLTAIPAAAVALGGGGVDALMTDADGAIAGGAIGGTAGVPRLPGPGGAGADGAEADDDMVSIARIEGQIKSSSVRKVIELVERYPEESLAIMRGWMARETAR